MRASRRALLALVLVSCTADQLTGPKAPARVGALVPGTALVISEVMPDPSRVADAAGEWFEVYNSGTDPINFHNYKIVSAAGATGTESHTIAADLVVQPGEYVVFGNNANPLTNGGAPVAYSYGGAIALNNGSSTSATEWLMILSPASDTLDKVVYAGPTSPTNQAPGPYVPPTGTSRAVIDLAADNRVISGPNWTNSTTTYGAGDRGSPGEANFGGEPYAVSVRASTFVTPGTSFTVTATATDVDGKLSFTTFTWSISDPSVATIDPATGRVTGVATAADGSAGIVTVTATSANGISDTGTVFVVNPGDVGSVSISVNDPAQVPVGYTKPAFPTTRTTTNTIVTPKLVWSSSDPSVATVDTLGYIAGLAPGKVEIRATAPNGVFGVVSFAVIPATAPTSAVYRNHVEFGTPVDVNSTGTILLSKPQYVLSYDPARGGPRWVSWNINKTQFGAAPRCDCFSADLSPELADVYHVVDFDYRNGGYDRGHMVQSESRTTTDQENASTFLLTNILPQGAENNQGPWSQFENYLNDLARSTTTPKEIYVVAGGIYALQPQTLKNEGKVAIPDYTWKVAVIMGAGQGLADVHSTADLQVIAIKMPNLTTTGSPASSVGIRNNPWAQYEVTVDQIENLVNLDLLAGLPDDVERLVEAKDRAPMAVIGAPSTTDEGSPVQFTGSGSSDPDGDALTYAWDFGDGATSTDANPQHTYADDGPYTVTLTVTDPTGAPNTTTANITVNDVAPVISGVTSPTAPAAFGGTVSVTVAATGASTDALTTKVDWGDGTSSTYPATTVATSATGAQLAAMTVTAAAGVELTHRYGFPGVFTITVTVTDDDGTAATPTSPLPPIVIYDPTRWVNGSGWLSVTTAGTYSGKTVFNSTVRYESGATTPTGTTSYALNDGRFAFSATSYDWLVIHDGRAQYTGTGTIAGLPGTYRFLVTEIDGRPSDAIRLKVWNESGVVYDNAPGQPDIASAATPISGGNINVR